MTTPDDIRTALAWRSPQLTDSSERKHAAVALLLQQGQAGLEVLFIRRSDHDDDPWSGNLAFPGGKIDEEDAEPLHAAIRETREEIGLDLDSADMIGRLDDIAGAYLPITVSCFVFLLPQTEPDTTLNEEVRATFWFPLKELANPERHRKARVSWNGRQRHVPGIDLLGDRGPVLWGITYRLVVQFLHLIDDLPANDRDCFDHCHSPNHEFQR